MTWPYDCPHVSGERGAAWCRLLGAAGCPVYWRTGVCAVCLGEWGAWRGTVMQHVEAFEFYSWLDITYGGSLQTDFKTHGDVCRSCEYGIDYKGRSFCCKPGYWVGGRTHGVRDCGAYVRSGVGWLP